MNLQSKFAALAILAGFLLGTINVSAIAFAQKPEDPDCFGEEASEFGKGGIMGEHSREGSVAGDAPFDSDGEPGRQGIGNVGGEGSETHPSELAEALNEGDCEED
jgi:hypothetical protein